MSILWEHQFGKDGFNFRKKVTFELEKEMGMP